MIERKKIMVLILPIILAFMVLINPITFTFAVNENLAQNSKASILMEATSGEILFENNSLESIPIASVTKQMTLLLIFEKIKSGELDLNESLCASENAAHMGGSQVFIDANSNYYVKDLLKAIVIASANDASVMLAERISGSEDNFVSLMNEKAKELKLENTNYKNCTGLPAPSQYSCAKDVAKVMRKLLDYPLYFELSGIWMEDFSHPNGRVTQMANTNKLIRFYEGCDAGKTGSTNEAGFCLAATAKKGDLRLISVVLGADTSKNRFNDAKSQFEWGFANFQSSKVIDKTTDYSTFIKIQKAKESSFVITPEEDFCLVSKKGSNPVYEIKQDLKNNLSAPLKSGDIVGKLVVFKDENIVKEINLIILNNVESKNIFETTKSIFNEWN